MIQIIETERTLDDAQNIEGKYLTFALSNEEYGLEILTVRQIIG